MQELPPNPDQSITTILQEVDLDDWKLELDKTDIQVYTRLNASHSNLIGFKTVTYHAVKIERVLSLLKDVCDAMNSINEMFVKGETFRKWPSNFDENGSLVRTFFKMPFPFKNREFLHGLHYKQVDEKTHIIAYTPIEVDDISVQKSYIRCEMFTSGQRVTEMDDGLIRVEHLMVYKLGGLVSESIQDRFLKPSHVKAYRKEWSNLRAFLFPPKLEDIDYSKLKSIAAKVLEESKVWPKNRGGKVGSVRSGRLPYAPFDAFRLDIEVEKDIETVTEVLADESLKYLPLWNREFKRGEVIKVLEESRQKASWLINVEYKTPKPLDNRAYTYFFSREWISNDETLITYCSVVSESEQKAGLSIALLYPSFHRCIRIAPNKTKIEHILATDLRGSLSKFQDTLLRRSLIKAQFSDMKKQDELFASINKVNPNMS